MTDVSSDPTAVAAATADDTTDGEEFRVMARRGLPPQEVKRLTRLSPLLGAWSLIHVLLMIGAAVAAAVIWWHPVTIVLAIVVISAGQHALAVLSHEAGHYRMFGTRWLNDVVGVFSGMLIGVSNGCYRVVHRLHHNHLYQANDPDLPLMAGYPRGKAYLWKKLAKDMLGLTAHKNYAYFFGVPEASDELDEKMRPLNDTSPRLRRAALRERWFVAAFHIAVPIVAFSTGWGVEYLVLWVLPLVTIFQMLLRLRAVMEHGAPQDMSSPITASRTNFAPWWLNWWLFPLNVNYHIEHHLYPSIPHYRLAECHRMLKQEGILEGAQVMAIGDTFARVFAKRSSPV